MDAKNSSASQRLQWMKEYEATGSVPEVCKKFSISRKTFYKWLKRYKRSRSNPASLADESRRPHTSPTATPQYVINRLKELREKTGFGQKRLQLYLSMWYDMNLSESTVWKLLKKSGVDMRKKIKLRKIKPHDPLLPGDRIVLTMTNIQHPINDHPYIQYTATDECTRLRITRIYGRHSTLSALDFVQFVLLMFPFQIRYVRTPLDNVFASITTPHSRTHAFNQNLRRLGIKHDIPTNNQASIRKYLDRIKRFEEVEPYCSKRFETPEALQREAAAYLFNYNNHRPIPQNNNQTPTEKLRSYDQFKRVIEFNPYTGL
jgi:transposase